jgi:hypothetical protein
MAGAPDNLRLANWTPAFAGEQSHHHRSLV